MCVYMGRKQREAYARARAAIAAHPGADAAMEKALEEVRAAARAIGEDVSARRLARKNNGAHNGF
jgi:hypothetical protein